MLGLLQGIGWELTCARYAIEEAISKVKYENYRKRHYVNNVVNVADETSKKNMKL